MVCVPTTTPVPRCMPSLANTFTLYERHLTQSERWPFGICKSIAARNGMAHTPERLRRSQEIRYCPIAITDKYPAQITPNNNPLKQVRRVFHFKLSLDASLTSYAPRH